MKRYEVRKKYPPMNLFLSHQWMNCYKTFLSHLEKKNYMHVRWAGYLIFHNESLPFVFLNELAPPVGFEPTTNRLTAGYSTIELQGNLLFFVRLLQISNQSEQLLFHVLTRDNHIQEAVL